MVAGLRIHLATGLRDNDLFVVNIKLDIGDTIRQEPSPVHEIGTGQSGATLVTDTVRRIRRPRGLRWTPIVRQPEPLLKV